MFNRKIIVILWVMLSWHFSVSANDSLTLTTKTVAELNVQHLQQPLDKTDVEQLYQRFERHYGDFVGPNPKRQPDFNFFMSQQTSFESFELY